MDPQPVLGIRIRRIRMFLALLDPDPDPLVRGTDTPEPPDPDPLVRVTDPLDPDTWVPKCHGSATLLKI
jgi:hypothetical protein